MTYDYLTFWLEEGRKETPDTSGELFRSQERQLLALLRRLRPASVLELGCGWGRIARLILENLDQVRRYEGVDLSPTRVSIARRLEREFPNRARFTVGDLFRIGPGRFDLVLAVEVLMHVPPARLREAVDVMAWHSSAHLVSVDWWEPRSRPDAAAHNFIHPYLEVYRAHPGLEKVTGFPVPGGLQWVFHARRSR